MSLPRFRFPLQPCAALPSGVVALEAMTVKWMESIMIEVPDFEYPDDDLIAEWK